MFFLDVTVIIDCQWGSETGAPGGESSRTIHPFPTCLPTAIYASLPVRSSIDAQEIAGARIKERDTANFFFPSVK